MTSPARLIAILIAVNAVLIGVGFAFVSVPARAAGSGIKVGIVFDIGGKNDKSFNEAAYRGLVRARAELGIEAEYIEPSQGADRESAIRSLATRGFDLVVGVGFIFAADLERLSGQFPDVRFAGIDYTPSAGFLGRPNLLGVKFPEHQGSFLVGAIAGLVTRSKIVGFVGGMRIPLIRKFEAGYAAGVRHVCPTCRVLSVYAGSDAKAFVDPPLGQELASAQYEKGADIIFHAAGQTGSGVFAAARQRKARVIGVDSDQFETAPCCVVTSMVKRVDAAVVDVIEDVIAGRFQGGVRELGLAEHGVTFVADERNQGRLLPLEVVQRVKQLREDIIAGKIVVPEQ